MTIKTYKTRELKGYSLHMNINGKITTITFTRGCVYGSTATYTTSVPEIQEALESLKAFGKVFYIDSEEVVSESAPELDVKIAIKAAEAAQEEEKEVVDMLDAKSFKNLVELRNALSDKGIDVSQITNVKAAESVAKKNGYNYTVEKNA